jgi:serine/threonine-protein kinase
MDKQTIQQQMDIAEQTGQNGDARQAASLYQALGKALQKQFGPYDPRALDAYEGAARWVRLGARQRGV